MKRILFLSLLSVLIGITACGSPRKEPDIRQNPHPRMRYVLTMRIEGAPGRFDAIEGYVMYQVTNDRCVPLQPGSGATLAPDKSIPITFHRIGDTYQGQFYLDQLQDEDYFGLGVCHWAATATGANLRLRRNMLNANVDLDDIQSERKKVTYFAKASQQLGQMHSVDNGTIESDYIAAHSSEFFSITLVARRDTP